MATKTNLMKILQERHGLTEFTNRQPVAKSSTLYLSQLRTHVWTITHPKRKFAIPVKWKTDPHIQYPVKIL